MVKVTLIAAVSENGVIGKDKDIPWYIPEDFRHFAKTTKDHVILMGSSTWDSLPEAARPLRHRTNVVLSSKRTFKNAISCSTLSEALICCNTESEKLKTAEIFVIGGASLYEQTIGIADKLIISRVTGQHEGDTYFPKIGDEWVISTDEPRDGFRIITYKRN